MTACAFLVSQVGYTYANTAPLDTTVIDDPAMTPGEMQGQQAAQDQTLQGMQAQAAAMQPQPNPRHIVLPDGTMIPFDPNKIGLGTPPTEVVRIEEIIVIDTKEAFLVVDQNQDGVLTAGEMIAALQGFRAVWGSKEGDGNYDARYDFNHSGDVNGDDLDIILGALVPLMSEGERRVLRAFRALDADGDYVLTAEEWIAGVAEFVRLLTQSGPDREYNPAFDLNGDGSIDGLDIDHFTGLFQFLSEEEQIRYKLLQIKAAFSGEDGELSAQEYLAAVDAFEKLLAHAPDVYVEMYDLNGDGVLNNFDIATFEGLRSFLSDAEQQRYRVFQAADENGDHVLTGEEMIRALRGIRASWGKREGEEGYDSRYDFDQSGMVGGDDLGILLVLADRMSEQDRHTFKAYQTADENGDGVLTPEEIIRATEEARQLQFKWEGGPGFRPEYDVDGSGAILGNDVLIIRDLVKFLDEFGRHVVEAFYSVSGQDRQLSLDEMIGALRGLGAAQGSQRGDKRYDPRYDFNHSGGVAVNDDGAILRALIPFLSGWDRYVLDAYFVVSGRNLKLTASKLRKAIRKLRKSLGKRKGQKGYRAKYDFDHSGAVTVRDAVVLRYLLSLLHK